MKKTLLFLFSIVLFIGCSKTYRLVNNAMEKTYKLGEKVQIKKKYGSVKRYDIVAFKNPSLNNVIDMSRVLGLPGEILELKNGHLHINGRFLEDPKKLQLLYIITTDGTPIDQKEIDRIGITRGKWIGDGKYEYFLTHDEIGELQKVENIVNIEQVLNFDNKHYPEIFPNNEAYNWNKDNFGPVKIPKEGEKITINFNNIFIYYNILVEYEKVSTIKKEDFINNVFYKVDYVFKNDYIMLMCDNRALAVDSRNWGFLPEKYVVGKAKSKFN